MKSNISFEKINYNIDISSLENCISSLENYLSTEVNGSDLNLFFNGKFYGINTEKLSMALQTLINCIEATPGNDFDITLNNIKYGVNSSILEGAVNQIKAFLNKLSSYDTIWETILPEDTYEFDIDESPSLFIVAADSESAGLIPNVTYRVIWDGEEYYCTVKNYKEGEYNIFYIGNMSIMSPNGKNTNEPFVIVSSVQSHSEIGSLVLGTLDTSTSHTLGVFKNGTLNNMNEYGFYFEEFYTNKENDISAVLFEDGSALLFYRYDLMSVAQAGTLTYSNKAIDFGGQILTVSEDGLTINWGGIDYVCEAGYKTMIADKSSYNPVHFDVPYRLLSQETDFIAKLDMTFNKNGNGTSNLYKGDELVQHSEWKSHDFGYGYYKVVLNDFTFATVNKDGSQIIDADQKILYSTRDWKKYRLNNTSSQGYFILYDSGFAESYDSNDVLNGFSSSIQCMPLDDGTTAIIVEGEQLGYISADNQIFYLHIGDENGEKVYWPYYLEDSSNNAPTLNEYGFYYNEPYYCKSSEGPVFTQELIFRRNNLVDVIITISGNDLSVTRDAIYEYNKITIKDDSEENWLILDVVKNGTELQVVNDGTDIQDNFILKSLINTEPENKVLLLEEQEVSFTKDDEGDYSTGLVLNNFDFNFFEVGESYYILWDGAEYQYTAREIDIDGQKSIVVGNDLRAPLLMGIAPGENMNLSVNPLVISSAQDHSSHTIAIYKIVKEGFPLTWNSLDVTGNTSIKINDIPVSKISNLAPSKEELMNLYIYDSSLGLGSNELPVPLTFKKFESIGENNDEKIIIATYSCNYIDLYGKEINSSMVLFVCYTPGNYDGIEVPEIGMYTFDIGSYGLGIRFTIEKNQ